MKDGPELSDFEGQWSIQRRIEDSLAPATVRFDGRAVLSATKGGLDYLEAGLLRVPGHRAMRAERRYIWCAGADGIEIRFDDGRPFHVIGPGIRPAARHACGSDTYAVRYDFSDWPRWSAVWDVTGPRKDYRMRSFYAPLSVASSASE